MWLSWNTLEGADDYRLQIFNTSQVKLVDTLIARAQITIPLSKGIISGKLGRKFSLSVNLLVTCFLYLLIVLKFDFSTSYFIKSCE